MGLLLLGSIRDGAAGLRLERSAVPTVKGMIWPV